MGGPLDGYRVVDATTMIAGPIAARMLGDQGADVIKLEPPGGELLRRFGNRRADMPSIFATTNRSKRSIVIDLKRDAGLAAALRLISSADVFLQNFRPGTAERLGIGAAALRERAPRLVYVSISGFGERGPYANKRVYDPIIQALSGLASIQGAGEGPRLVRTIVPDKLTAVTAAQAITAALLARERSGEGQHVRLAMLDAMVAFLWPEGMAGYTWEGPGRAGGRPGRVPDLIYETTDGHIVVAVMSDAEWRGLAEALGHPEWLADARFADPAGRDAHAPERIALTGDVLRTASSAHWLERLDAAGVPCAPVLRRRDLLDHPQIAANEIVVHSQHPHAGPMRDARPAARFEGTPTPETAPAPLLGEHTDEVLGEIGLAAAEIGDLRRAGAVA